MFSNQHQLISNLNLSLRTARLQNYRLLLVLAGEANQHVKAVSNAVVKSMIDYAESVELPQSVTTPLDYITHVPDVHSNSDASDEINALLGDEHACIIFDAQETFNERLFAAAAGTIVGGGLLVLQTPTLTEWAKHVNKDAATNSQSLFITRLCKKLEYHHALSQNCLAATTYSPINLGDSAAGNAFFIANTAVKQGVSSASTSAAAPSNAWKIDQNAMLDALLQNLLKNEKTVTVVQGDRGRGKSALIGRALRKILSSESNDTRRVSITANRRSACTILLKHAQQRLPFLPIDSALWQQHDVLVVEEAGSIPIPILEQLMNKSQSIVFATTVQGYEGAGRGFAIRFAKKLDKLQPDWLKLNPSLPVRWSTGDPVEAFVNDAMLLNTELAPIVNPERLMVKDAQVSLIDKRELANNDQLLNEIYGLLVQAHYQTTPADLRNLLDKPGLVLFAQKTNKSLTGAALVAIEGVIPGELHQAIMSRQRRLADQLLPQLLAQTSGEPYPLAERFARVVRIAVHPVIHRQGFGTHLYTHLRKLLSSNSSNLGCISSIGASFGADQNTLSFWLKQGLKPIHYGYKANPRSALRAACLLSSTQPQVNHSINKACQILHVNTAAQLSQLSQLPQQNQPDAVLNQLLDATASVENVRLSAAENRQLIQDFCLARRSFTDTVGLLLTSDVLTQSDAVSKAVQETLNGYQLKSPSKRRAAEAQLRSVLQNAGFKLDLD